MFSTLLPTMVRTTQWPSSRCRSAMRRLSSRQASLGAAPTKCLPACLLSRPAARPTSPSVHLSAWLSALVPHPPCPPPTRPPGTPLFAAPACLPPQDTCVRVEVPPPVAGHAEFVVHRSRFEASCIAKCWEVGEQCQVRWAAGGGMACCCGRVRVRAPAGACIQHCQVGCRA